MRRIGRVMAIFGLALTGVVVLAGCAWVYMSSSIETPDYQVESSDGAIETRRYPAFVVAEVIRRGDRYTAVRNGFGPLAGYIFAKERAGEKIAMTAPVTQRRREEGAADWTVQFIMPAQYSLADLPAPVQGDVTLTEEPPARRAAIRFSGVATDELIAEQEGLLRAWLAEKGLTPLGAPIYAYYNDPFTPGFLRRNEVLIDLADG